MKSVETFILSPVDTLFFRDARPMQAGAGSGGHGDNWPMPHVIYKALRSALLRKANNLPATRQITHTKTGRNGMRIRNVASDLFRSLRTIGPFPVNTKTQELFMPLPSDIVCYQGTGQNKLYYLSPDLNPSGNSNFPAPWLKPVVSPVPPSKVQLPQWVTLEWFRQYLTAPSLLQEPQDFSLYNTEERIGIALDDTKTTKEKMLYSAQYIRLREEIKIWLAASLNPDDSRGMVEGINLDEIKGTYILAGGESKLCRLHQGNGNPLKLLENISFTGNRLKWTLVLPAFFEKGWLPNWINEENGSVFLKKGDIERKDGEDRLSWRKRIRNLPEIKARLIAVRLPLPLFASGWRLVSDANSHGPKATLMFVPAGSVYYFEADSETDALALFTALHGKTPSDRFGECGMGLGFCSRWQPLEKTKI